MALNHMEGSRGNGVTNDVKEMGSEMVSENWGGKIMLLCTTQDEQDVVTRLFFSWTLGH